MTVGELKRYIEDLPNDMVVVTDCYNDGYGGHFEADASIRRLKRDSDHYSEEAYESGERVLRISNYW